MNLLGGNTVNRAIVASETVLLLNQLPLVFDYKPQDAEVRCMAKVAEIGGILIYKRNDE